MIKAASRKAIIATIYLKDRPEFMLIAKGLSETESVVSRERTKPGHEAQKNMKQLLSMKPAHQEFPETQRNTEQMLAISLSIYCRI